MEKFGEVGESSKPPEISIYNSWPFDWSSVQHKILEGENFGEFGKLYESQKNFLVQNFPL